MTTAWCSSRSRRFWVGVVVVVAVKAAVLLGLLCVWLTGPVDRADAATPPTSTGRAPAIHADTEPQGTPDMQPDEKIREKTVTGQVNSITKRAISIEYASKKDGSYEMLLPLGQQMRFVRLQGLADLRQGDTVEVTYQQRYKDVEDGEPMILGTTAQEVALIKRAQQHSLGSNEGGAP